ncbi:hypothetical protein MK079_04225 [Candidatus Gracilibacteria bacterium]|nr:hypothetical protein [Candidatus Gracilibacteria bacterium]
MHPEIIAGIKKGLKESERGEGEILDDNYIDKLKRKLEARINAENMNKEQV